MSNRQNIVIYFYLFFVAFSCLAQSQHPRLLFDQEDIPGIWKKINENPVLLRYYEDLRDDAYDNRAKAFYNNRYDMHYASDMAFVYLVDTKYPYRNELKDYAISSLTPMYKHAMNKIKARKQISWPLSVCSTVFHITLVYDLLYSELSFQEKRQIAKQIKTILDGMEASGKITLNYANNWEMHLAAALGIGVITIKGDSLDDATVFTENLAAPYIDMVNEWIQISDKGMFATDGSSFEGAKYAVFGAPPMVAYYEVLRRDGGDDLFQNSNLKRLHEWLISELLPAEARHKSISKSLFDFNPINSSFNWKINIGDHYATASTWIVTHAVLGGIYRSEPTAGAATWLFEHHLGILLDYTDSVDFDKAPTNYFGTSNILVFIKYASNARHPDSIEGFPRTRFFLGRGLIVRDGYAPNGTLFTFETNYNYNPETGKPHCRHDEDDNNSFTFFAYGRRWVIDCAQLSEESKFHNTVLIDGYHQPYCDRSNYQITNWYDYHNSNDMYYIISDITDAWKKKIHLDPPFCSSWCNGIGAEVYYTKSSLYPDWSKLFSSLNRYRRHAQFIQKEGGLPPYIIIYDDIKVEGLYHDYTFLLHTGSGNTVGNFDSDLNKVRIKSSDCIMDVYVSSVDVALDFSTQIVKPGFADPHECLMFTARAINPRFHAVLVPSGNSESAVSDLSYNDLCGQGSLAKIQFSSGSQNVTDYSLFSYQKSLNYKGFALEGYSVSSSYEVPGIMGYCRRDEAAGEITDIFLSRGSYLKIEGEELVNIAGRTARVILNDDEINIYKVNPTSGRYSYKIYGKDVSQLKINEVAHPFQNFNDYNYIKSTNLITNYDITVIDSSKIKISWYCPERHDMKIYYWDSRTPNKIYTQISPGRDRGNSFLYIELGNPEGWCFKLEGIMHVDKFIDLTNTLTF